MKIVSLGNNCFWGLLVKSTHILNGTVDFYSKTCFLSHGLMTSNGNTSITKVDQLLHFLQLCDDDDFSWLNYNNVSYKSNPGSTTRDWLKYYWYDELTMPYFFRHIDGVYIDNPNFFNIVKTFMQYKANCADKYILAVFDNDINDSTVDVLNNICKILKKWNPKSEFIVFSESKLESNYFINVNIMLGHCQCKPNEDYTVDEQTYTAIVNAIGTKVMEHFFLDKSKIPTKHM